MISYLDRPRIDEIVLAQKNLSSDQDLLQYVWFPLGQCAGSQN
jgi:hypothetical protein